VLRIPLWVCLVAVAAFGAVVRSASCGEPPVQAPSTAKPTLHTPAAPLPVPDTVQGVLDRLRERTEAIRTYQGQIRYLFIQEPELLDSRTLNEGALFYARDPNEPAATKLRINFLTRQQDDGEKVTHREEFLFDGVWLTRIDYQLRKVDRYQKAPVDKPLDVFELIGYNFPIIGFTQTQRLAEYFDIRLLEDHKAAPDAPVRLQLKGKKASPHKDDYDTIGFWIDRALFLPRRIVTTSTQGDIYDITFLSPKLNKKLPKGVFAVEVPADFDQNTHPLPPPDAQAADNP